MEMVPCNRFLAAFLSRVFSCRPSLTHTPTVPHLQRLGSNTVIFLQASQNFALWVTACLFCRKSKDVNKRLEHSALGWAGLSRVRVNYWLKLVYSYQKSVRTNNAAIRTSRNSDLKDVNPALALVCSHCWLCSEIMYGIHRENISMCTLECQWHAAQRAEQWKKERLFQCCCPATKACSAETAEWAVLIFKTAGCLTASVQKSIQRSIVFHRGWALGSGLD